MSQLNSNFYLIRFMAGSIIILLFHVFLRFESTEIFLVLCNFFFLFIILIFIWWNVSMICSWNSVDFLLSVSCKNKFFFDDDSITKSFRTGDILLFSGSSFAQKSLRSLIGSYFDHCSMVIRNSKGELFLWESDIGQKYKKGTRLIPIKEKLDQGYKGNKFFVCIPYVAKKEIDENLLQQNILKNKDKSLKGKLSLLKYVISHIPILNWVSKKIQNGKFCSELIAETLIETNVFNDKIPPYKFSPGDFTNPNMFCENINSYGDSFVVYF